MATAARSIFRAGSIVAAGVLLGRVAGFARELLIAHHLGGGRAADVAIFTLTLPDVFTNLLVGGALGAALIPEFQAAGEAATRPARALFLRATLGSLVAFGLLSLLVVAAGPGLARLLAPGIPVDQIPQLTWLLAGSAIVIPFTAAAAVSTAYLQAFHRFGMPAAGTLIYNAVLIGFLVWRIRPESLAWIAVALALAAILRWLPQIGASVAVPVAGDGGSSGAGRITRPLVTRYVQALGSSGLLLLVPVAGRAFVSEGGPGAFAGLNYVYKLAELPLGMLLTVLSVVLLPRFSALFAEKREAEGLELARWGIWVTWILSIPIALCGAWFRAPLVSLLFGHGRMSVETVRFVSDLTAWSMASLPAQGLSALMLSILSARKDTRSPLMVSVIGILLYLPAAWGAQKVFGPAGVVAAGSVLHWGIALSYGAILSRGHGMGLIGGGLGRDLAFSGGLSAAGFLGVAVFARPGWGAGVQLLMAAAAGVASFLPVLALSRTRISMKAFH